MAMLARLASEVMLQAERSGRTTADNVKGIDSH
jgi:hypothetical protein